MKLSNRELINLEDEHYEEEIASLPFGSYPYLKALKDISAKIDIYRDISDKLNAHVTVKGIMVCPDAWTLQEVELPFNIESDIKLYFDEKMMLLNDENGYYLQDGLDTFDLLLSLILPEVPIKVVKEEKKEYPRGDGWRAMTEAELNELRRNKRDSRWDKLNDLDLKED